jgi:hypothetical protein
MSEATVPKRSRLEPEPTAGAASSATAAALPVPAEVSHLPENPDGATTETVLMQQKRVTKLAKQLIMVSEIRSICNDATVDPGAALAAIADVLGSKTDSEDEAPSTGRIMLPAEDVVSCGQQ